MPRAGKKPLLLALLSIVVVGCGESSLDVAALETELERQLAENAEIPPDSVSCPSEVSAERGTSFNCAERRGARTRQVRIVLTDGEGGFRAELPDVDDD
ncbi:MAG: DUF4333 domain-containing protein [Solirubrobacterales bacterium]